MRNQPVYLEPFQFEQLIAPGAWLLGSFFAGYLVYRLVFRRLKRTATLTAWGADTIFASAARDGLLVWFALAGAFGALRNVPLRADVRSTISRGLTLLVVLSVTWIVARVLADVLKLSIMRSQSMRGSSTILINLSRVVIFLVGALVSLQVLGVPVGPLLGALGIGGLAIALALQDVLSNFFAGIQLLASRKIQPGDFIELASGRSGWVTDINWRNTTIRTQPDNHVIIPNSTLANEIVVNYNRPAPETGVIVPVGVHYESDLDHVERVTVEVAREVLRDVEGAVPDFEPFIRYSAFSDSQISFNTILRTRTYTDRFLVTHEFLKRLHRRYEQERIKIPYPTIQIAEKPEDLSPGRARTSSLRAKAR